MTKLFKVLISKDMTQRDLQRAIVEKHNFFIGDDRISRMVTGRLTNYHVSTASIIADTLEVKLDDIVENFKTDKHGRIITTKVIRLGAKRNTK